MRLLLALLLLTYVGMADPSIVFHNQTPADVTTFNAISTRLNITYNISGAGINYSTVTLYYKTNSSINDITYYLNGSEVSGFKNARVIISNSTNETWHFLLGDNQIYPATYNFDEEDMESCAHTIQTDLNTNQAFAKIELFNVSSSRQYGFFEIMAQSSATRPIDLFYCNSSYTSGSGVDAASCSGAPICCVSAGSIPGNSSYNHSHGVHSYHHVVIFAVNTTTQTFNNIKITPTSYFLVRGQVGGGVNVYGICNVSRENALQLSTDNKNTWSNVSGTADAHLHQYCGSEVLYYFLSIANDSGDWFNSTIQSDSFELAGLPPSSVAVYSPTNLNYSGVVLINYSEALSPQGYPITYYNISLLDSNYSFNATIQENNSLNLTFLWNSSLVSDGDYVVRVQAVDNMSQSSYGYSELFAIDNVFIRVVQNSPSNDTINQTTSNISFSFTPSAANLEFANCSIMSNASGTWTETAMNQSGISNDSANVIWHDFTYSQSTRHLLWAVSCVANDSTTTVSDNRTLMILQPASSTYVASTYSGGFIVAVPSKNTSLIEENQTNVSDNASMPTVNQSDKPVSPEYAEERPEMQPSSWAPGLPLLLISAILALLLLSLLVRESANI